MEWKQYTAVNDISIIVIDMKTDNVAFEDKS